MTGRLWSKVDHCETNWQFPDSYRMRHTFSVDVAYLCKTHPYTHSDMCSCIESLRDNPSVKVGAIGKSRNGVVAGQCATPRRGVDEEHRRLAHRTHLRRRDIASSPRTLGQNV